MNGKSCSWANRIIVVHDSDSDSEQSVFDALTANDDGECQTNAIDTTISNLSSKRIREQTVEDDTRPNKIRRVESSDRITRSKTSTAKNPVPSPRVVHFSVSNEPLVDLSETDGESSTVKCTLLQRSSNKIPTVTLRRFLAPGRVESTSASSSTPASSDPTTWYSSPPMTVEDMLDQAGESLETERVKEMFEHREHAVEAAKDQLRNMDPEQMIEEAARIVVDRAEICNDMESLEKKWNQNERMQEEIFELVIDRFTSFQEKLIEEVIGIKRKWQASD